MCVRTIQERRCAARCVIYYRAIKPGLVEIVRILHERMEPGRWLGTSSDEEE